MANSRPQVFCTPQIPNNTGGMGRTVIGLGARLHLVEPLGFKLDDKNVRDRGEGRAGGEGGMGGMGGIGGRDSERAIAGVGKNVRERERERARALSSPGWRSNV